jgi:phage shock protein E
MACSDASSSASASASTSSPSPAAAAPAGYKDFDVKLAKKLIADGALVLDVRTPGEFASGHVNGATLLPIQELDRRMAEVEKLTGGDKTKPIVVYCASGVRSGKAKQMLMQQGYTKVQNAGGVRPLL